MRGVFLLVNMLVGNTPSVEACFVAILCCQTCFLLLEETTTDLPKGNAKTLSIFFYGWWMNVNVVVHLTEAHALFWPTCYDIVE
jgi:hypothetical protein